MLVGWRWRDRDAPFELRRAKSTQSYGA